MSDEVTLSLKSEGLSEVIKSLHNMRDAVVNAEKESTAAVMQGASQRIKALKSEYKDREALAKNIKKAENDLNSAFHGNQNSGIRGSVSGTNSSNIFGTSGGSKGLGDILGGSNALGSLATKAGVAGAAFALVKGGIDMAMEGLKAFGSFLVNDIVKPGFKLQTLAQQIENNSNGAIKAADVESRSRAIATKYNMDPSQVAESGSSFGESTGDYKLGFQVTEFLAGISKSTGAKMEDLSGLANALYSNGMSFQDVKNQLLTQIGQGQVAGGKFTIKQMSTLGGGINEPASMVAGGRDVSVASTTAMIQLAGKTSKGVDDALTNVKSFVREIAKDKTGAYKSVVDSEGLISDPRKAIEMALVKTQGGKASQLAKAGLTSDTSAAFLGAFTEDFNKAMKGKAPTVENFAKAAEYATENFNALSGAVASEASVRDGSTKVLNTSGEKLETMFSKLKDALAEKVMPAADKFVADFVSITPALITSALTLAKAFIWFAGVVGKLAKLFGGDEGEDPVTGGKKGSMKMNFETGKFEFVPEKDDPYAKGKDLPVFVPKNKYDEKYDKDGKFIGFNKPIDPNEKFGPPLPPEPVVKDALAGTGLNNPLITIPDKKGSAAADEAASSHKAVAKEANNAAAAMANFSDQLGGLDLSGLRTFPLRH